MPHNQAPRPEPETQQLLIEGQYDVTNGDLVTFPIQPEQGAVKEIQLARIYNEPGQQIDLEDTFWASAEEPDRDQERKVILLTESGRKIFFRGNEAIDALADEDNPKLIQTPLSGPTKKLPPPTIGERYIFSDGEPIIQVCIAEDVLVLDENPDVVRDLNDQGVKHFMRNPFEKLDEQARLAEDGEKAARGARSHPSTRRVRRIVPMDLGTNITRKNWKYSVTEALLTQPHSDVDAGRMLRVRGMDPDERKKAGMVDTDLFLDAMESAAEKDWEEVAPKIAQQAKKSWLARLAIVSQAVKDEALYGGEGVSDEELKERKQAAKEAKAAKKRHPRSIGGLATKGWEKTRGVGQRTKRVFLPEHGDADVAIWGWRGSAINTDPDRKKLRDTLEATGGESFQHSELIRYPKNDEGLIPLAESFSETGDPIVWEAHPFTSKDDAVRGGVRKAMLISESNHVYYLRGDTLYDISRSVRNSALVSLDVTKKHMPDLVIGITTPSFSKEKIKRVVVNIRPVEDKPDTEDLLEDAEERKLDPFVEFDKLIDSLS